MLKRKQQHHRPSTIEVIDKAAGWLLTLFQLQNY
jgi:hypothetical protein